MPLVTRASLPEEFFDITSAMMLKQPEPQYPHALLWKSALGAALAPPGSLGLPGATLPQAGAPIDPLESHRLILDDSILSAAVKVVPELGNATVGHTIRVNRPYFQDTTYTQAVREVASGATISTTPINLSSEQVPITIKRFGGPYDQTNSRVAPFGVERFDCTRAVHNITDLVGMQLVRDFDKTIDSFMIALMDLGEAIYPTGMSAVDDATTADSFPLDFRQISAVETSMDEANIPVFPNGRRVMILTPRQIQELKEDSEFQRMAEFHAPVNPVLAQSYYKSVGTFDIFKSKTLNRTANSSSVAIQYGQAFGPGAILSGVGEMPYTTFSKSDNYGENALVVWLLYAGFAVSDVRFLRSVRSS